MGNRNGMRKETVTFLKRSGHPVTWTECCTMRVEFIEPKTAQSVSQIGNVGLRRTMPFLVKATQDPGLEAGLLMRQCKADGTVRYWSVDSRAEQRQRRDHFVMTCREFEGMPATYIKADGTTYTCRAAPVHRNIEAQLGFNVEVTEIELELLLVELVWPWLQRKDRIIVQGVDHTVDGSPNIGYDGYSIRTSTVMTPGTVTAPPTVMTG